MGLIVCEAHGEQGLVPSVSVDICEQINRKETSSIDEIYVVSTKLYDEGEFVLELKSYFSKSVFEKNKLSFTYSLKTEEDEEKLDKLIPDTDPVCVCCFQEYLKDVKFISGEESIGEAQLSDKKKT